MIHLDGCSVLTEVPAYEGATRLGCQVKSRRALGATLFKAAPELCQTSSSAPHQQRPLPRLGTAQLAQAMPTEPGLSARSLRRTSDCARGRAPSSMEYGHGEFEARSQGVTDGAAVFSWGAGRCSLKKLTVMVLDQEQRGRLARVGATSG